MMSAEFSAAGDASGGKPAARTVPKPRRQAKSATPAAAARSEQLSTPQVMTDEPEGYATGLPAPEERGQRPERVERQAPVDNVRDLRRRAARTEMDPAPPVDAAEAPHEGDEQSSREAFSGDSANGEEDGGDDSRAPHRKGRSKRRRRGRGEDSDGAGGGSAQERLALDPEEVSKRAWKIYLGEVSEEGLALINDTTAREMAKRSFRLAEIFIEEQSRRA